MKKITITLIIAICCITSFAQPGATCNNAIPETSNSTCTFTNYTTCCLEMWFSFTATSTNVQITVINQAAFGTNAPHTHNITLFSGSCANLNPLEEDELVFLNPAAELTIDASGLIIGNTYYIRVQREATGAVECFQGACFPVIQNASFALCIQDIDVFIPLDFNLNNFGFLEKPVSSHIYHTNKGQIVDTDGNPRLDVKLYTIGASPAVFVTDTSISYVYARVDTTPFTLDTMHRVDMKLAGGNPAARIFRTEKRSGHLNYYLGHIPTGITKMKGYSRAVCNNVYPNIDLQYYSNSNGVKYYFIVHQGGDADAIVMRFEGASSVDITGSGGLRITTSLGNIEFEAGHAYQINPSGPTTISPMPWQAEFVKVSANEVKFDIRKYPKNKPLIIQVDRGHSLATTSVFNCNLDWSTFYGNPLTVDFGMDICNDNVGNTYVVGYTTDINFPTLNGFQTTFGGGSQDAVILKFNKDAERMWTTLYGGGNPTVGGGNDFALGVHFNKSVGSNHLYVVGYTSSASNNFPLVNPGGGAYFQSTNFPYLQVNTVGFDAFILRMDTASGIPSWSTFFGGNIYDEAVSIISDVNGNVYIVGNTSSNLAGNDTTCNAPSNNGFPLCNPGGGAYYQNFNSGGIDVFIAKFDSSNILMWSTFMGSFSDDKSFEIAVLPINNNVYVTGSASGAVSNSNNCGVPTGANFPLCTSDTSEFFQTGDTYTDGFVSRFSSSGVLLWSTLIHGIQGFQTITTDSNNIFVVGLTNTFTNTYPSILTCNSVSNAYSICDPGNNAYIRTGPVSGPFGEIYIAKFDTNNLLTWSTFYGHQGTDESANTANGCWPRVKFTDAVVNQSGTLYIMGVTNRADSLFPTLFNPAYYNQSEVLGVKWSSDVFMLAFLPNHQLTWASLIGGSHPIDDFFYICNSSEFGSGISAYKDEAIYINGYTASVTYPYACLNTTNPYCYKPDVTYQNILQPDIFISRFNLTIPPCPVVGFEDMNNADNNIHVIIYPNPAGDYFTIRIDPINSMEDISIRIYNILGQKIVDKVIGNQSEKIEYRMNINGMSKGFYLVRVIVGNTTINNKLIIN